MPELPEVETVCRVMRRVLAGHVISELEVVPDSIIFGAAPIEAIEAALCGRRVESIGRKGKIWWIDMGSPPVLFGHLGMTGWIRELGASTIRLREHGEAPLDDETGRPRFLKLLLTADTGKRISFTDGRRLGRVWLGESPAVDRKVSALGPDALDELPKGEKFYALFGKRTAPIKALLMNQSILSGIGNWIADEVLYHARIAPHRDASTLTHAELDKLRKQILKVLTLAVEVGADHHQYPPDWMFHHRWGGGRGQAKIGRYDIVRDEVGGRTTAWVPALQH
jgi:formamidopyrimidine-DNA glycosylase